MPKYNYIPEYKHWLNEQENLDPTVSPYFTGGKRILKDEYGEDWETQIVDLTSVDTQAVSEKMKLVMEHAEELTRAERFLREHSEIIKQINQAEKVKSAREKDFIENLMEIGIGSVIYNKMALSIKKINYTRNTTKYESVMSDVSHKLDELLENVEEATYSANEVMKMLIEIRSTMDSSIERNSTEARVKGSMEYGELKESLFSSMYDKVSGFMADVFNRAKEAVLEFLGFRDKIKQNLFEIEGLLATIE